MLCSTEIYSIRKTFSLCFLALFLVEADIYTLALSAYYIYTWPMEKVNDVRHGRHCVFKMHAHLVFVTKYRGRVFTREILDELKLIFSKVCSDFESELVEFEGEDDHVHLLINYPPKFSVSSLVNSLKGVSSRLIKKREYPSIQSKLWAGSLWSPSYFAGSCGGAPISVLRLYIENQSSPD